MLFSSKLHWIQRPMKSIEIFPLPTASFWSCHNFILQRIAPSHPLRFLPLLGIVTLLPSMPPFLYFFQKILAHFSFITEDFMEKPDEKQQNNSMHSKRQTSQLFVRDQRPIYTLLSTRDLKLLLVLNTVFGVYIWKEMFIHGRDIFEFH